MKIMDNVLNARTAGLNVTDDGSVNVLAEVVPAPAAETPSETPAAAAPATPVTPVAATPATPVAATPATPVAAKPAAAKTPKTPEFKVKVDQLLSYMKYYLTLHAPSLAPQSGVTMLAHYRANRAQIDAVLPLTQQNPQLISWEMACTNKTQNNEGDENGPKDGFRLKTGRFNKELPVNVTGELGTTLCYPQWWRDDKAGRGTYNVQWHLVRNFVDAIEKREAAAAATPAAAPEAETPSETTA